MDKLLEEISACTACEKFLEHGVNPVISASPESKIVIIGQAPGRIVHNTGVPWNDKSGDNLRKWMNVEKNDFYDTSKIALIPMGFCYPGTGKTGDLPPRKECAPLWHHKLLEKMPNVKLVLLVGQYAINSYLGKSKHATLTETVKNYHSYLPKFFPLPHPSPRNNIWMAKNRWFQEDIIPVIESTVNRFISC